MGSLEIDSRLGLGGDQEQPPLLVLDEQVLGMRTRDALLDRLRFGDGEDGLVLDRVGPDSERAEIGQEIIGRQVGQGVAPGFSRRDGIVVGGSHPDSSAWPRGGSSTEAISTAARLRLAKRAAGLKLAVHLAA